MEPKPTVDVRLRAAVESSPSGLLMIDSNGIIVLVNREVERLFGYSREELLGRPVEMLVPERFREHHPGDRSEFFAHPRQRKMGAGRELFGRRKDGSEVPIEIGLTPVATEEGLYVISSIVDITDRKAAEKGREQLEEQLRQAQKMEAVGRLAGGIAHDFNNILGAIVGFTELARDAATDSRIVNDLERVLEAAARGKELVERILRFSRRQEVVFTPMDLGTTVGEAIRLIRATLPAGIEIELRRFDPTLPRVMADGISIHQVVMNLATNAAHAMPSGGRLEVGVEPFYVRDSFARAHPSLNEGEYLLLTVTDSGRGMDEATRARAFEPFFTTKAPGRGSGMGLSVVHGILQDHGGTVWIESEPELGTSVKCLFPSLVIEGIGPKLESSSVPRGNSERILYVDDEPSLATVGRRRLEGLGYQVETATDPIAALERFAAAPGDFDLVLTDFSMPRMSGLELARKMVALRPDVPILLLTGYMDELSPAEQAEAGLRRILTKPVTAEDLAEAVHASLLPA